MIARPKLCIQRSVVNARSGRAPQPNFEQTVLSEARARRRCAGRGRCWRRAAAVWCFFRRGHAVRECAHARHECSFRRALGCGRLLGPCFPPAVHSPPAKNNPSLAQAQVMLYDRCENQPARGCAGGGQGGTWGHRAQDVRKLGTLRTRSLDTAEHRAVGVPNLVPREQRGGRTTLRPTVGYLGGHVGGARDDSARTAGQRLGRPRCQRLLVSGGGQRSPAWPAVGRRAETAGADQHLQ